MFTFVDELQGLGRVRDVRARWVERVQALGVVRGSYHFTPAFASQTGPRTLVYHFGFPEAAAELYANPQIRAADPIPDRVMQLGRPTSWKDALKGVCLTPEQSKFVEMALELSVAEGYGVPLYGPNGRSSYSTFSLGRKLTPADAGLLEVIMGLGQIAHCRICTLIRERHMTQVKLSQREQAILQWLASSKSINDIATILDLAPATVDTYVRRIYAKLKTTSRLGAVSAGLAHGLIHF